MGHFENSKRCPKYATPAEIRDWFPLYSHYAAGHLHRAGGIEEQPALYLAVMRLIDHIVKEPRNGSQG